MEHLDRAAGFGESVTGPGRETSMTLGPSVPGARPALSADLAVRQGGFQLEAAFQAGAAETLALVGPNGAGKTTLLLALAGLLRLERGRVEVAGLLMDEAGTGTWVPPGRRPIGVVFQDLLLFPHLTVLENVAYGLRRRAGLRKQEAHQRAEPWLDRLHLSAVAHRRPAQLSGGEAQRVALARALATEPKLLLLDEPLSALDAEARPAALQLLGHHLDEVAGTRIIVTHDAAEATALAHRILVLEAGHVVQQGTPAELAASPRSPYVAALFTR